LVGIEIKPNVLPASSVLGLWIEPNAWCPRLSAAMILSACEEGLGWAL
jgi:hypothetical protein